MRYSLFIVILSLFSYQFGYTQNYSKDTLYLKIDTVKVDEWSTSWKLYDTKYERSFGYHYFPLYDGSPLQFDCADRSLSQVVSQNILNNYPIRTLEQLKAYINTLTYKQALKYLEKMKRYYIVEILPNGTAEIIPVKLDMRID